VASSLSSASGSDTTRAARRLHTHTILLLIGWHRDLTQNALSLAQCILIAILQIGLRCREDLLAPVHGSNHAEIDDSVRRPSEREISSTHTGGAARIHGFQAPYMTAEKSSTASASMMAAMMTISLSGSNELSRVKG